MPRLPGSARDRKLQIVYGEWPGTDLNFSESSGVSVTEEPSGVASVVGSERAAEQSHRLRPSKNCNPATPYWAVCSELSRSDADTDRSTATPAASWSFCVHTPPGIPPPFCAARLPFCAKSRTVRAGRGNGRPPGSLAAGRGRRLRDRASPDCQRVAQPHFVECPGRPGRGIDLRLRVPKGPSRRRDGESPRALPRRVVGASQEEMPSPRPLRPPGGRGRPAKSASSAVGHRRLAVRVESCGSPCGSCKKRTPSGFTFYDASLAG